MKKFKITPKSKNLEASKLTKEQMYLTSGGLRISCTCYTQNVCHIDGTDD